MTKITTTNGKLYDAYVALESLSKRKLDPVFSHTVSLAADVVEARIRLIEKDRLKILALYQATDPDDATKKLFFGKTAIPQFIEGGQADYDRDVEALNEMVVELDAPLIEEQKIKKLADPEPFLFRGLRPFFAQPKAKAPQAVAQPNANGTSEKMDGFLPLPVQRAGARPSDVEERPAEAAATRSEG